MHVCDAIALGEVWGNERWSPGQDRARRPARAAGGDTVKLELLGRNSPYYRGSNGVFTVEVSGLTVSLPTA